MSLWFMDLETTVFSIVKTKVLEKLSTQFPNIYITNSDKVMSTPLFPTVFIHEMSGVEQGTDIEGKDVNAVLETFQVDITSNVSQRDVKVVMSAVVEVFKQMRFNVTAMPEFNNNDDVYRAIARFRRVIGANDILI